ncbi:protein involved in polysaccharide export, contains SLBB domain of the beta-grasp fold [Prosthecobacter debontii]|uniref:Protein involved in polysaccharide export, contains SLBB domain of the beta-grasp fold n=2 Tax=Prosthecobacter debontii TaxID=48467 RepID=A0A1T4XU98_9BACT|nr:protein involved in polysaccharide export, contains SLBB domain of the beta-grasp fold [Prosthecobacter debontii]
MPPARLDRGPAEFEAGGSSGGFSLPFDPLRIVDAIYRHLWWMLLVGLVAAAGLAAVGLKRFDTHYIATAQLIKQAPLGALRQSEQGDPYQAHELSLPTLIALMRGSVLMEKTSQHLGGKVSEGVIKAGLQIVPERNSDIVRVSMTSDSDADTALNILSAYTDEVLTLTRDIQQHDAAEMRALLSKQVEQTDLQLVHVNEELLDYAKREQLVDADKQMDAYLTELGNFNLRYETIRLDRETVDLKIQSIERELAKVSVAAAKLQQAREELAQLELRYTHEHPTLIEAMERVKHMEAALAGDKPNLDAPPKPGESTVAESLYLDLVKLRSEKNVLNEQMSKLEKVRDNINAKLEQLPRKALEYAKIRSRKQALETSRSLLAAREREAAVQEENAPGSYRLLSLSRLQDVAVESPTQKLAMVTAAGFAGTVGGLACLVGLIAGLDRRVISRYDLKRATGLTVMGSLGAKESSPEEWAFQTWTKLQPSLLIPASGGAAICGLLMPKAESQSQMPMLLAKAAASRGMSVILMAAPHSETASITAPLEGAVCEPESVLQHLRQSPQQVIHLVMDDTWTWTHEQRQQWQRALVSWAPARGTVILVQLASPGRPETLLVAERLPNLVWIGQSGSDEVESTQAVLKTCRAAGCRLVGAVLDQAPRYRLGLLNKITLAAALFLGCFSSVQAAESLTLGPGDAINITVIGQPEYARTGVTIGPDGRLTYLQAQGIQAAGLTIDELRQKLSSDLSRYYKNFNLVVTPMTFQSRKVYVLGKVVKKGAINLDRPLTLLEVVAEAGGLETGLFQQNTVELADLGRSFLIRGQSRLPVDMEALFLKGDMTQNVLVQPGDYLYFPSANSNEIYVMGDVKMQGTQGLLAHTSVHSAIAQAGGFTPKAYTKRVLIVRGSLEKPETFVVNMDDILSAKEKGFRLEPKDIVYIADKPWARAEELLSFALNAFTQGAVSAWAGGNVGPLIQEAILPTLR